MVAVAQFIPQDPDEKESVLAVLREHPELQDFITRASEKAKETFADVRITLDTVRYDDWDPPARMLIQVTQPWDDYKTTSDAFVRWVSDLPDYNRKLIFVWPQWNGPIESYPR